MGGRRGDSAAALFARVRACTLEVYWKPGSKPLLLLICSGLSTAERAEIRVQWPDGDASPSYRVFANQFVVIDRSKPQAAYWYPPR